MNCAINTHYTKRELVSMALWDQLCELTPATKEDRALSAQLDREARIQAGMKVPAPRTEEQKRRQSEYLKKWREENKESINAKRRANRKEINEAERGRRAARKMALT